MAVEVVVGYTAGHARHAHRSPRARARTSSPCTARVIAVVCFPRARPARAHCGGGGARSLALARTLCGDGDGGRSVGRLRRAPCTPRAPRITRAYAHFTTALRACHHRFPFPRTTGTHALRRRRFSLARSIARTRCGVGDGGGGCGRLHRASCASRTSLVTLAHTHVITAFRPLHHRYSPPPRTTGMRALLRQRRSLARSIARTRCGVGGGGGGRLHRMSRASCASLVTRANAHVNTAYRARHHRPLPRCHPCARAAAAAALSRLLAEAEAVGLGRWWRLRCMARGALTRALTNKHTPRHSVRV